MAGGLVDHIGQRIVDGGALEDGPEVHVGADVEGDSSPTQEGNPLALAGHADGGDIPGLEAGGTNALLDDSGHALPQLVRREADGQALTATGPERTIGQRRTRRELPGRLDGRQQAPQPAAAQVEGEDVGGAHLGTLGIERDSIPVISKDLQDRSSLRTYSPSPPVVPFDVLRVNSPHHERECVIR